MTLMNPKPKVHDKKLTFKCKDCGRIYFQPNRNERKRCGECKLEKNREYSRNYRRRILK